MRLEEYLTRIGVDRPLPPDVATLRRLHIAHLAAFPFDNLQIQRHGIVRVDVASIEEKFLGGTTGGYCFEQNTLFGSVLRELGFDVSTLLGRVGSPERRSLNHMILLVRVAGERWLADVGFGGEGPLEPLQLREGLRQDQNGIVYTLGRGEHYWSLSMEAGGVAHDLYEFSEAPHTVGDVEMANFYTSSHPESIFRKTLTIQRTTAEERLILRPTIITSYRNGVRTDTTIDPSQLRAKARELFGIELGEKPLLFETLAR